MAIHQLLKFLDTNKENRGISASLRRSLKYPSCSDPDIYKYVIPFFEENISIKQKELYFIISNLFSMNPNHENNRKTIGYSLRNLENQTNSKNKNDEIEKKFMILLKSSNLDLLISNLRKLIMRMKDFDITIDYCTLFYDLLYWNDKTRLKWSEDFYGVAGIENDSALQKDE